MFQLKNSGRKTIMVRICFMFLLGSLLFLALVMPLRGLMNAVSRIDFISQRLDDYPRMYAGYIQENEEWWNWWMTEDYGKRAEQAALIFDSDRSSVSPAEKLDYIAGLLDAEDIREVTEEEYRKLSEKNDAEGLSTCSAKLKDGRILALTFNNSQKADRMSDVEAEDYFLSQLQAGLPGYIAVLHNGELSVYPKDGQEEALTAMIRGMLENGTLDPAGLREKAGSSNERTALKALGSPKTDAYPKGRFVLHSAAYADNPDFVMNITEGTSLIRFGRKRSWSLWFLCCAVMVLLVRCLWKTRLYVLGQATGEDRFGAAKRGISAMFLAVLLIFGSVTVIQMLSGVNLSQQGATDQAEYLKKILDQETDRGGKITEDFDSMYASRARTAASFLSRNPGLRDVDLLLRFDQALGGSGIRVFHSDGTLAASDEILHHAVDESLINAALDGNTAQAEENGEEVPTRYYRAPITDDEGKISGWVELCVGQDRLDNLLQETHLKDVVEDLHILDTLHVVVAEGGENGTIVASTWKNWAGDKAEEHGIQSQFLYDGYEGIVNFEGNKCYSVVFSYGGDYVIVGSEDASALVFFGGVAVLSLLLILVLFVVVYLPTAKMIGDHQKKEIMTAPDQDAVNVGSEFPQLGIYLRDFMIAVFLLSAVLYFTTKGDPAGLTYNIVRGTWIRGINAATITTCIMLISVVFAVQWAVDTILLFLGRYLSPKGMTVGRLLDSGLTYISTIAMIIYTLSMFGVNTKTLLNGVGVTALIFTLGANSLIADVLAGLFIIFEGDYTVGDVVVIDDFRGIVTDISMRTTKLMDDNTQDILIVNNSKIQELINQSRERSVVILDIPISRTLGLQRGEVILKEAIKKLPEKFPQIIGSPEYWGVSKLPEKNERTEKFGGPKARIAFNCRENDKEVLTYNINRELVELVNILNVYPVEVAAAEAEKAAAKLEKTEAKPEKAGTQSDKAAAEPEKAEAKLESTGAKTAAGGAESPH